MTTAAEFLKEGLTTLEERGKDRDKAQERSMKRIVTVFNAATGHKLSERDGWLFMVALKLVRAGSTPEGKHDDYVDGLNYFALAGESVPKPVAFTTGTEDRSGWVVLDRGGESYSYYDWANNYMQGGAQ